jgi:predicted HD phosphohydrolase
MNDKQISAIADEIIQLCVRHGADYLRAKGFSERLARLVESQVQAKRYLTFKFPKYYDLLSPASKQTLEFQGGRMNATEADAFEQDELFSLSIRMRRWDELAKKVYPFFGSGTRFLALASSCSLVKSSLSGVIETYPLSKAQRSVSSSVSSTGMTVNQ